ncbi:MAG: ComEC/Rec2 family competence protein [Treponema sp.]|nr:ComEC/Rec2 family competence protein [Treponema sp.]
MVKRIIASDSLDSFVLAAMILCICFYTGAVKAKNHYFFKSLSMSADAEFCGRLESSPVKVMQKDGKSDFYKADFRVFSLKHENGCCFSCEGTVQVFLPAKDVEAFHPGKLYSQSNMNDGKSFLLEEGLIVVVKGFLSRKNDSIKCISLTCLDDQSISGSYCNRKSMNFHDVPSEFFTKIYSFRGNCRLKFRRLMYSWGKAGALFLALLSGIREYLDEDAAQGFKLAGLSHILALSGMHLSLFSSISLNAGKLLVGKKFAVLFQVLAVVTFVWFAGLSPSLFRALLCTLIGVLLRYVKVFSISQFRVLCMSFLLHVSIFPFHVSEISFMLSYGALAGILLFGKFFTSLTVLKIPSMIANSIGSSTAAITFTSPVTYARLGSFSPIGIVSTALIGPLVNLFIYSGLLFFILSICFPFLLSYNAFFMQFQYNVIITLVGFFSSMTIF